MQINLKGAIAFTLLLLFYTMISAQSKIELDSSKRIISWEMKITYPKAAQENKISGTVIVAYDIDSNCKITNIRIEKSLGYGCDEVAITAMKKCKLKFVGKGIKCNPVFNLK